MHVDTEHITIMIKEGGNIKVKKVANLVEETTINLCGAIPFQTGREADRQSHCMLIR